MTRNELFTVAAEIANAFLDLDHDVAAAIINGDHTPIEVAALSVNALHYVRLKDQDRGAEFVAFLVRIATED